MLFNSVAFLIFLPVVLLIFFGLPPKGRLYWVVFASSVFYMWFVPQYILIILALIVLDYSAALMMSRMTGPNRKHFLWLSIAANLLMLSYYKYFNFLISNLNSLAELLRWDAKFTNLNILLPIGLSFHTLQSLSYVVDVYRGQQQAERNFVKYAAYVMFFPQLVAGPIERAGHLLPQLKFDSAFDIRRTISGLQLMLIGFYKKVIVADTCAILVNTVYQDPHRYSSQSLFWAACAFAVQLYCDFSGYSDIARGVARIMGVDLVMNFNHPFHSRNFREMWRRWHISLSNWLREYIYKPLRSKFSPGISLLLTFLVSGLWHGPSWNFIVWGLLNGFIVLAWDLLPANQDERKRRFKVFLLCLLNFLTLAGTMVFFRVQDIPTAASILVRILTEWGSAASSGLTSVDTGLVVLVMALGLSLEVLYYFERTNRFSVEDQNRWKRWSLTYVSYMLFFVLIFFAISEPGRQNQTFIYFQF